MKVVYDFRIFSRQRHGGISRYFYELAKCLSSSHRASARILAPFYVNHYLKPEDPFVSSLLYMKKLPAAATDLVEKANLLSSKASLLLRQPDILHETYYGPTGLAPSKSRTVTTVYDMIHEKFPEFYPGDETARLKAASVKRADHIFCISRKTQEDLVEMLGVDESKTSVTHLGCDFHLKQKDVKARPFSFPYLLFVGPRGAHKNFRSVVRAVGASERLKRDFKVVCFGSSGFQPAETEEMRAAGASPDLFIHVKGDDDLLPTYYAHAELFIYPSLYEGFGFPPLEAMSLGCPTACSRAGSIPEVLGDATEYFPPEDIEALKQAVESIVYSPAKRASLSAAGKERAARFTWERCAQETYKTYEKLKAGLK